MMEQKTLNCLIPKYDEMLYRHFQILGMNIIEVPVRVVPKLKLSDSVQVSDEFRAEFDAWLVQMFGTNDESPIPPGTAYMFGSNILMRPESVVKLMNCCL